MRKVNFAMGELKLPSWEIHNYWCKKINISEEICKRVNEIIDFPKKWIKKMQINLDELDSFSISKKINVEELDCIKIIKHLLKLNKEFQDWYSYKVVKIGHDFGRKQKWKMNVLLKCVYDTYGVDGVKAALLHHILDYIEQGLKRGRRGAHNILNKVENKFGWVAISSSDFKEADEIAKTARETLEFVKERFYQILKTLSY